jgi:hypothetical protein
MPVILATQETEIRRITGKWFAGPYVKNPITKKKKLVEQIKV